MINTRIGVTKDIRGYNEETKVFDMPVLDADSNPVELSGSTITFSTKGFGPQSVKTVHENKIIVSPANSTYLRWDLTTFPKQFKSYEVKIVRTDALVIVLNGTLEIEDSLA